MIYFFLFCVAFALLYWGSVCFRLTLRNPHKVVYYSVKDLYRYIKYKLWKTPEMGKLNAYIAEFGGGKTLSIVHDVITFYMRYNNVYVWDFRRNKKVLQKVHILSNVELTTVPFEPLISLSQFVSCAEENAKIDEQKDTLTLTLLLLDEASSQLNSRDFRSNLDGLVLSSLLACRHYHISIYYSTQKFNLTDKLLRDVTQKVIHCHKVWRFMVQNVFYADDLEYATDPTCVRPIYRKGFFIRNLDYDAYDTLATVDNLKKSVDRGDMMSTEEIIAMRGNINPDNDNVKHPSKKLYKRRNRKAG